MTRQILLLIMLITAISCSIDSQKNKEERDISSSKRTETKVKENIRFDFTATRINTFQETIEIKASIFNDNADTIYFLSSSCDGEQYSFRYDTTKFALTPFLNCNASYPRLMKIAPKGQYDFQAHFRCSSDVKKIKLGFDFYSVDKIFEIDNVSLAEIHQRSENEQKIIWTEEKIIK